MAKSNRTNPNPEHRSTLKDLYKSNVLSRVTAGLKYIIRAEDGAHDYIGFSCDGRDPQHIVPDNFHPYVRRSWYAINYNGKRTEVEYTTGSLEKRWVGTACDPSTYFITNRFIKDILKQANIDIDQDHKRRTSQYTALELVDKLEIYGDAYLTTDYRKHWTVFGSKKCQEIASAISTPHSLSQSSEGEIYEIFFHEEPNESDLMYITLSLT